MNDSPSVHPPLTLALDRAPAWVKRTPWLQRLLIRITGVSISTKIMGIVLALTILLGLAVTLQVRNLMARALQGELHNQGIGIANDLADSAAPLILANDTEGLNALIRTILRNHPDSRYAFVLDSQRHLLASATRDANGDVTSGSDLPAEIINADLAAPDAQNTHLHDTNAKGRIHDFVVPIRNGSTGEQELGVVRLALAETRLSETISAATEQMFFTTLVVAGVGILAALLLTWLLTRPILDLVTTTEEVRGGDLTVRAPHWTDDEIGALSDAFNQMVSELEISQQTVIAKENTRTHLLSRLISAQEEERKRIARELHDGVGQALTSILVHIKVLAQNQDAATQARMAELRQLVDQTLADVRMLSRELRPSALDDLGLAAALERYMAEFRVRYPKLETDLHCTLPHRLPPNIATSLYRIIQEAMTNTARHSHATSLSVVVNERAGVVHAIIEDNGAGFDVESARRAGSSVGLHSMNERSELLNGTLEIESSSDGTTVYVEIPLGNAPLERMDFL
jgi:signal transduction histidine kinase